MLLKAYETSSAHTEEFTVKNKTSKEIPFVVTENAELEERSGVERKESEISFNSEVKKRFSMLDCPVGDRFSRLSRIRNTIFNKDNAITPRTKKKRSNSVNRKSKTIYKRVAESRIRRETKHYEEGSDDSFATCYEDSFDSAGANISEKNESSEAEMWTSRLTITNNQFEDEKTVFSLVADNVSLFEGKKTSNNNLHNEFKDIHSNSRNSMTLFASDKENTESVKRDVVLEVTPQMKEMEATATINSKEVADKEQILKDIGRTMNNLDYFNSLNEEVALNYKSQLKEMLFTLISNKHFHYYQGYNELCSIFLLVLGKKRAIEVAEVVSKNFIGDFLLDSFEKGVRPMLFTFNNLLQKAEKELYQTFAQFGVLHLCNIGSCIYSTLASYLVFS